MELLRDVHQGGATTCMVTHDPRFEADAERGRPRARRGKSLARCPIGGVRSRDPGLNVA